MSEEIVNHIIQILIPVVITGVTGVFSWVGINIKNTFEEKVKSETVKSVANDTVKYVEQVYYSLKGPEKLKKATDAATEILKDKGIKVSKAELYVLIESSVIKLKQELNLGLQHSEVAEEELDSSLNQAEETNEQIETEDKNDKEEKLYILVESSAIGLRQELTSAIQRAKGIIDKLDEQSTDTDESNGKGNRRAKK